MITADDIQIFIMTRNRKEFLKRAIQSLLDQDTPINEIIVLDNSDNSETENLLVKGLDYRIRYVRTTGRFGNYEKSLELAKKKYVMLFHDDDVMHPNYLSIAIRHLNDHANVALISSWTTHFKSEDEIIFSTPTDRYYLFHGRNLFAQHMYLGEGVAFASAIYRTSNYLGTEANYRSFGKYNDWPFLVNSIGKGRAILLADSSLLFSRVHPNQDSVTRINSLDLNQIVNWDAFFHESFGRRKWMYRTILNQRATRFASGKYQFELGQSNLNGNQIELLSSEFSLKNLKLITNELTYLRVDRFFYEKFIPIFMKRNLVEAQTHRARMFCQFFYLELSLLYRYITFCFFELFQTKKYEQKLHGH
jgi:glycosyltransferase involved in cell wall biosynthesis